MAVILYALWMLRAWYREVADLHLHQRLPVPWISPLTTSGKFEDFKDFVRSNFEICEWVGLSVVAAQFSGVINHSGMVLRTLGPDRETDYDSDDDTTVPARLPLLRNQAQHGSDYAEPNTSRRSDSWKLRILDKVNN
ncbi:unnamed protein product [Miscanthus lutarioriparius]|uniref:Uncharacterized protein n=1 Tax=Miscanthus lutarioriparius TaxID=422564 RepID=A0A811QS87_9POAL|nr:unnamed protein product [Miscanthus lutarioriparius]